MSGRPVIVGAGLAGLSAARRLTDHGISCSLVEAGQAVGGRVATDATDGFLLDRGFQVLLTAYEEAARVLDFEALELSEFEPGSLIRVGTRFVRAADPWRRPGQAALSLFSGVMRLSDAPRLAAIRRDALKPTISAPGDTTYEFLKQRGLSDRVIERFMRPFLGGVFLDSRLETPRWMFDFVFGKFAVGAAALPAHGMAAIPEQLASSLPAGTIRLGDTVRAVHPDSVELASGERLPASHVIVATDQDTAAGLVPGVPRPAGWRGCTTLYFAAEQAPVSEAILVLNGDGPAAGLVNSVCVPSNVAPAYAPPGSALVSVTTIGVSGIPDDELSETVRAQLRGWYGEAVRSWRHLRTYRVPSGLPRFDGRGMSRGGVVESGSSITVCGDWLANPSIDGAMVSGRVAADRALRGMGGSPQVVAEGDEGAT